MGYPRTNVTAYEQEVAAGTLKADTLVKATFRLDPVEAATLEAARGGAPRNPRPEAGSQGIIALRLKVTKRKHWLQGVGCNAIKPLDF